MLGHPVDCNHVCVHLDVLWGQLTEPVEYRILWWHWKLFPGRLSERATVSNHVHIQAWKELRSRPWKHCVHVCAHKNDKIIKHKYHVHVRSEIVPLLEEIATPGLMHLCQVACLESCPPPEGVKSPISAHYKHLAESENTSRSWDSSAPVVAELSATFSLLSSWVLETSDCWESSTICKSHLD